MHHFNENTRANRGVPNKTLACSSMKIHDCIPFSLDKNLGKVYNQAFESTTAEWLCLRDYDTMYLSPNSIPIMYKYIEKYPDTGIFICRTNRIGGKAVNQLAKGLQRASDNDSIIFWESQARRMETKGIIATEVNDIISGYLMLVSRKTWEEIKFTENMKCLGVDNQFSEDVLKSGKKIRVMESILVWHTYRLTQGIHQKSHLL